MQALLGKRVSFDVNVFIYALEPSESMQTAFVTVSRLFELAASGQIVAMTSELSLAEALVGAYQSNPMLVTLYESFIKHRAELAVYAVDREVLTKAAWLRSQQKTALADAIHVATALIHQADFFITHDKRLQIPAEMTKLTLEQLQVL